MSGIEGTTTGNQPPVMKEAAEAPLIYFDLVPTFGMVEGVAQLTLAHSRYMPGPGGSPVMDGVIAGHLRCPLSAAKDLRDALDKILLMAAPTEGARN